MVSKAIPEAWLDPIEQYVNFSIASGQGERTIELREYQIGRFAAAHPDGPASVTPRQVLKYVARTDWVLNTRIAVRNAITSFYRWALADGLVMSDPTTSLPPMPVAPSNTEPISRKDFREALTKGNPRQKLMIRLGYEAGLSAMEIATMRIRDIQEQDGDYWVRTQGKAGAVRRMPLPPALAEDLLARGGDYLFAGSNGRPWAPAYISRLTSRVLPEGMSNNNLVAAFNASGAGQRLASWREQGFHAPSDSALLDQLSDVKAIHKSLRRIEKFIDNDPATAISECKNILETLAKHILTELNALPAGKPNMPQLNEALASAWELSTTSVPGDVDASQRVAEDIQAQFRAVADVRNALGTGHGGVGVGSVEARHARLAFNSTVTVGEFLLSTWREQRGA